MPVWRGGVAAGLPDGGTRLGVGYTASVSVNFNSDLDGSNHNLDRLGVVTGQAQHRCSQVVERGLSATRSDLGGTWAGVVNRVETVASPIALDRC